jgi:hypothetical protein
VGGIRRGDLLGESVRLVLACWECEAPSSALIEAALPMPWGQTSMLRLCPGCYRRYYLPLIASAGKHDRPVRGWPMDAMPAPNRPR